MKFHQDIHLCHSVPLNSHHHVQALYTESKIVKSLNIPCCGKGEAPSPIFDADSKHTRRWLRKLAYGDVKFDDFNVVVDHTRLGRRIWVNSRYNKELTTCVLHSITSYIWTKFRKLEVSLSSGRDRKEGIFMIF